MCHHVRVTLSAEDKQHVKKLSGMVVPVYASILLALLALLAVTGSPPQSELIASATTVTTR
jgi:hypothetical protein